MGEWKRRVDFYLLLFADLRYLSVEFPDGFQGGGKRHISPSTCTDCEGNDMGGRCNLVLHSVCKLGLFW